MGNDIATRQDISSQIAQDAIHYDIREFVQGQADCRDGIPHKDGKGDSYDAGYSAEYQLEQIRSGRSWKT